MLGLVNFLLGAHAPEVILKNQLHKDTPGDQIYNHVCYSQSLTKLAHDQK